MNDRKKYQREWAKKRRQQQKVSTTVDKPVDIVNNSVDTIDWHPEVDQAMFDGRGCGVPVDGFVLISLGKTPEDQLDCGVVTEQTWRTRLRHTCEHNLNLMGWSCKACLT